MIANIKIYNCINKIKNLKKKLKDFYCIFQKKITDLLNIKHFKF